MELPFALNFLKKLDSFQVFKKLDGSFEDRVKNYDGMVSTWEAEKKILLWAYNKHFHLGSPLTVNELKSRKSIAVDEIKSWNISWGATKIAEIQPIDATDFEMDYERFFDDLGPDNFRAVPIRAVSDRRRIEIGITPQESDKAGIRETFGNLVSRGYATYYPDVTKIITGYEGAVRPLYRGRPVYEDVTTSQADCEGIFITNDGLTMGELISDISKPEMINRDGSSEIECLYKTITGADQFLYKRWLSWSIYQGLIWTSYLALLVAIWLIIVGAKDMVMSIWSHAGEIINYLKSLLSTPPDASGGSIASF